MRTSRFHLPGLSADCRRLASSSHHAADASDSARRTTARADGTGERNLFAPAAPHDAILF